MTASNTGVVFADGRTLPMGRVGTPALPGAGFTLVEVLVSLSILVIMMASVGEIFRVAGKSVRLGQATLETMSNVRTLEAQFQHDLSGLDRNGFLIIRGNYYAPPYESNGWHYYPGNVCNYVYVFYQCISGYTSKPGGPIPSSDMLHWQKISGSLGGSNEATYGPLPLMWQDDQLCFTAQGTFHHRTGNYNHGAGSSPGPFMDYLTSNSAVIWYGQLYVNDSQAQIQTNAAFPSGVNGWPYGFFPQNSMFDPGPGLYATGQTFGSMPIGSPPTGIAPGDFVLGRHVTLLIAGSGSTVTDAAGNLYAAYYNQQYPGLAIAYNDGSGNTGQAVQANTGESTGAFPASSRVTVAATSISQINAEISSGMAGFSPATTYTTGSTSTATGVVADAFCYRYNTLAMPNASEVTGSVMPATQLTNGYFRMTPIMMPGVPSFTVQWTDGTVNSSGFLNWYGLGYPLALVNATSSAAIESLNGQDIFDPYVAVFDTANRSLWPKALKITYTVTDPNNQLEAGRVITQVIRLPGN